MEKPIAIGIAVTLGLVVAIGYLAMRESASKRSSTPVVVVAVDSANLPATVATAPRHVAASRASTPAASGAASARPAATAAAELDESTQMVRLRDLLGKDPLLAVKLAREGNTKRPNSPFAAERGWIVVKSLTDMGMFDEARVEARMMVDRYRNTDWAIDVERHVLVHPPGPPEPATEP